MGDQVHIMNLWNHFICNLYCVYGLRALIIGVKWSKYDTASLYLPDNYKVSLDRNVNPLTDQNVNWRASKT